MLGLFISLVSGAVAGDGPWTLEPGDRSLYAGASYFRYSNFSGVGDAGGGLGDGLTAAGLVGVYTGGLARGIEVELVLPYERVRVNDPSTGSCTGDVPDDFCKATRGLGDASAQFKFRLVDELYAFPVTVAVAAGARTGEAYSEKRHRLTTLGDGQTDVGAGLSVGRTDLIGQRGMWYRVGAWGWYWYRFGNGRLDDGTKVPGDEVAWTFEATLSPHPRFGVGPAVYGFHRLSGVDLPEVDFNDPNVWNSLRAAQIQAGGKVGLFAVDGPTFSVAVLRTVWAQNNPSDTLVVSAGVGWFFPSGTSLFRG